jgi:hypothetical protein
MKRIFYLIGFFAFFSTSLYSSTYYWVGNGGDWNDYNMHWATTSGGSVFYNQPPTANDDVVFDMNSFTLPGQTVTLGNGSFFCKDLHWNGVLFSPYFGDNISNPSSGLHLFGSIDIDNSMSYQYQGELSLESSLQGNIIHINQDNMFPGFIVNNPAGSWGLQDSLYIGGIALRGGTFNTNNYSINGGSLVCQQNLPKTLNLGTSKLFFSDSWYSNVPNTTVDADSAFIKTWAFYAHGQNFNKVEVDFIVNTQAVYSSMDSCRIDTLLAFIGSRIELSGAGNSIGYFRSDMPVIITQPYTFHYADIRSNLTLYSDNIFDTLALNNGGSTCVLHSYFTQVINNAIITSNDSCSAFVNIEGLTFSGHPQAGIQLNGPDVAINKVTLKDIVKTGTALLTATNSLDLGNVTDITITAPISKTVYWVNNGGNWNDAAHWSYSSGGPSGACVPTRVDNVVFDVNSLTQTDTLKILNFGTAVHSLDASGLADTLFVQSTTSWTQDLNVYGSFILSPFMKWYYNGTVFFRSADSANAVSTGQARLSWVYFEGDGSWIFHDSLSCYELHMNNGRINTNGYQVRCGEFRMDAQDTLILDLDTSRFITTSPYSTISGGPFAVNGPNATMEVEVLYVNGYSGAHVFDIGALKMTSGGNVSITGGTIGSVEGLASTALFLYDSQVSTANFYENASIGGINAFFGNVHFYKNMEATNVVADTVFLQNPGYVGKLNGFFTANSLVANYGACDPYSKLYGDTTAHMTVNSGISDINNLLLYNIHAQGGATLNAVNGVDLGNVSGWNFIGTAADTTFYWINGTGSWVDQNHWSYSSGGPIAGCLPSPASDVVFDANSFAGTDTVFADIANVAVRNMSWYNLSQPIVLEDHNPALTSTVSPGSINIFGDLLLDSNLVITYQNDITFVGSAHQTITTNGTPLYNVKVSKTPGSKIEMLDDMTVAVVLLHKSGNFITNNHALNWNAAMIHDSLQLGTSAVNVSLFSSYADSAKIAADSATINAYCLVGDTGNVFGNIHFHDDGNGHEAWISGTHYRIRNLSTTNQSRFYFADNITVDKALFTGDMVLTGPNIRMGYAKFDQAVDLFNSLTLDTLFLNNPGYQFRMKSDSVVVVNNKMIVNSNNGNNIFIHSDISGVAARLVCNGDTVCMEYMSFQDIDATAGTAPIYAGQYSTDISGNSGINFTACILPFSDVWPGDANNDGVVDNFDLLNIGIAYNETGYARAGADISWTAQGSQDWNRIFSNFVNIKHADCDGNGTIDYLDTLAVSQNYLLTHALIHQTNAGEDNHRLVGTSLSLTPASMIVSAGQMISIPVQLGSSSSPAMDIYGIAYKLNYDNTKIAPGSLSMIYPSSWFTPNGNRLPFTKHFPAMGRLDNAQSRIDLTNVTGNGTIAYLNFQVDIAATGTIALDLTDLGATDRNGNPIQLSGNSVLLQIDGMVGIANAEQGQEFMLLYPNPTAENAYISYGLSSEKPVSIEIYDMLGNKVYVENAGTQNKGNHMMELKTAALQAGVYQCVLRRGNTVQMSRIVKTK